MVSAEELTKTVQDLMDNDFEDAAEMIVDLVEALVADESDDDLESVLSLTLPDLQEIVGREDSSDEDL